jgi:hypothetical protein
MSAFVSIRGKLPGPFLGVNRVNLAGPELAPLCTTPPICGPVSGSGNYPSTLPLPPQLRIISTARSSRNCPSMHSGE